MHQHLSRTNLHKISALRCPICQNHLGFGAASFLVMTFDQIFQHRFPMRMAHTTADQSLRVNQRLGLAFWIIEERHAPRHSSPKVGPDAAQNYGNATGHILTTVGSAALNHHMRPRIAHSKAFTRPTGSKEIAVGRTIKHRVANDGIVRGNQR